MGGLADPASHHQAGRENGVLRPWLRQTRLQICASHCSVPQGFPMGQAIKKNARVEDTGSQKMLQHIINAA
jgi:hypothetical protein